ncbi:MAG: hypothetical protein JWN44_2194 [Myxococcales bacterium]|nr:hypothetical protein [Myxococcales bacterium]
MSRASAAVLATLMTLPLAASARPLRPRFEPSDMELEEPGVVEVDLQMGVIQSRGPYRVVAPDLEIDVGIWENLELDLDWTYAIEQPFDHSVQDNVWLALKVGLLDVHDVARRSSWALGLQFGPRLGAAPGASGAGFEALALLAREMHRLHLVFNAGGIIEPRLHDGNYRPLGFEAGLDGVLDLDDGGVLALTAAFAAVHFVSIDPDQIVVAAGLSWSPRPWLSLSVTGLVGFLDGGDRVGILVGYSQKLTSPTRRAAR